MAVIDTLRRAGLTGRQMQCLAMYYYDGLRQREIAAALGVKQRVVSKHIAAGLKKLRACGMEPQRCERTDQPQLIRMTTEQLDGLGPSEIRAAW